MWRMSKSSLGYRGSLSEEYQIVTTQQYNDRLIYISDIHMGKHKIQLMNVLFYFDLSRFFSIIFVVFRERKIAMCLYKEEISDKKKPISRFYHSSKI